jgi:competence protein ComEC
LINAISADGLWVSYAERCKSFAQSQLLSAERWLDTERDQLPIWFPVGLGIGIFGWDTFGDTALWPTVICAITIMALCTFLMKGSRLTALIRYGAGAILLGFVAISIKSSFFGAPPISKLQITEFYARIVSVERIAARDIVRLQLETARHANLPSKVRVNLRSEQYRSEFLPGSVIRLRARLVPPAGPALPGGYDFARRAWFQGIGATGTALGEVTLYKAASQKPRLASVRQQLSEHILHQLPGANGAIAAALATGDQGGISERDAEAMRDSGLAHLLSISGLHVTAMVGAIFIIVSRFLALSPYLALRIPIPVIAACAAAVGAIGYTLLTGSEVPTIRSCVAAILVLVALILGRDALSLRLVAFGASVVLIFWPESLAGPSFQLSFAAVTTIIVLHESQWMRRFRGNPDDNWPMAIMRTFLSLLITGLAIEIALAPIALFHFHKTGLYGALANVVAIPLTTFVVMPAEALALVFDSIGLGAPFWWLAGAGLDVILWIAHTVRALPGAVSMQPSMPNWAFGSIIMGALWLGIFQTKLRIAGSFPLCAGFIAMMTAPTPDILITGDGKHLALVDSAGNLALLRDRAGEYVRDTLRETAGVTAEPIAIEDWPGAECTSDSCVVVINNGAQKTILLALRSKYRIPVMELAAACRRADIVVSDRWLPASCKPKWLKADRKLMMDAGGLAIFLNDKKMISVADQNPHAPWEILAKQARANNEAAFQVQRKLSAKTVTSQ